MERAGRIPDLWLELLDFVSVNSWLAIKQFSENMLQKFSSLEKVERLTEALSITTRFNFRGFDPEILLPELFNSKRVFLQVPSSLSNS